MPLRDVGTAKISSSGKGVVLRVTLNHVEYRLTMSRVFLKDLLEAKCDEISVSVIIRDAAFEKASR